VYLAQNATQAASLFWYWAENIPEEIKPFYQAYIERFEKAPDEFFHYWSSGLTSSPGESANSKIAAEIRKGKHLSDEGLAARIVVVDDRKRSKALGSDEISESDVERQAELSTDNSAARSERMAERYRNRKAKVPAADALPGENRKAPSNPTHRLKNLLCLTWKAFRRSPRMVPISRRPGIAAPRGGGRQVFGASGSEQAPSTFPHSCWFNPVLPIIQLNSSIFLWRRKLQRLTKRPPPWAHSPLPQPTALIEERFILGLEFQDPTITVYV
jgi:hypothetical protein